MKNLLLALPLLALGSPAAAITEDAAMFCSEMRTMAGLVMQLRQMGYSQSELLLDISETPEGQGAEGMQFLAQTVVTEAYQVPLYSSDWSIDRSILEFQDSWENVCIETLSQ